MNRLYVAILTLAAGAMWTLTAASQPPEGRGRRDGPPPDRPPRFELGRVLPPFARGELKLTRKQEEEIAKLEKEVKQRLEKILTAEQRKTLESLRPPGPGGPGRPGQRGGPPERGERPDRPEHARRPEREDKAEAPPTGLVKNPRFTEAGQDSKTPAHYVLEGDAEWAPVGQRGENAGRGIVFHSGKDLNGDGGRAGSVAQDVTGFAGGTDKWFRFSFRGLAERNFVVRDDGLVMKVDFYSRHGANYLDGVTRKIYPLVERDRKELAANGKHRRNGGAVWKTYALEFKLPFAEIDQLRLSVGFRHGAATTTSDATFAVTEFALTPIAAPVATAKSSPAAGRNAPSLQRLIHLGGRWYYDPEPGMTAKPATLTVTAQNAGRLYYKDNRLTNPFAENMTAWLRKGDKDLDGRVVAADRFIGDNVVLEFKDDKTLIVHSRNLPNHPTAQFPEVLGYGGNPNYIQEQDATYYLPLDPVHNPRAVAMDKADANRALPMGPTGIAINGVVFFNPFDAGMRDATDLMDRCCGHPSPDNTYHYHKYPVCIKSPFVDEGEGHSPVIGWAFDGFPIYGPYESKGVMAKDSKDNPLNGFNIHYDEARGWHYHVTPGKFPYIIGGYWGKVDARDLARRGPRPR